MPQKLTYFFTILTVIVSWSSHAQSLADTLQRNKVRLTVEPNGHLFHNLLNNTPAYEVPADGGNHLISMASAWFMGKNDNDQIKASINYEIYYPYTAHFNGPYSATDSYLSADYLTKYKNNQWRCTKEEVIFHIDNHSHPNYTIPDNIANWPGNGDTTLGVAFQLAPFVDLNDNGVYEPELGEYPCFKGDEAIYTILNDNARKNVLTDERGMGLELHYMVYQINNGDYIDSTTFVDFTVYNRGNEDYPEFRSAFFVDGDVGFAFDDYVGSHPATNTLYFYNSTNHDPHYGENPPAVGITTLNHEAYAISTYFKSGPPPNPFNTTEFWRLLNGKHRDGTPIVVGGDGYFLHPDATSTETKFYYHGEPWSGNGWSEVNIDGNGKRNPSDWDKRGFMATNPITLNAGEQVTFSYAIVTSRKGDYLENTKGVVQLAEKVKIFYDESGIESCLREGTGVQDNIVIDLDEIDPFLQFEITLLDGTGNMLQDLELTAETVDKILQDGSAETPTYERTKGPIIVEIADTANHATGHFRLWFRNFSEGQEYIDWVIYQHEYKGGEIIDSVHSTETILIDGVHYIEKWEFFVQVNNYLPSCGDFNINCPSRERTQTMIAADMVFKENIPWLTGVHNLRGWMPQYWITDIRKLSLHEFYDASSDLNNPHCYNGFSRVNNDYRYSNLIGGIIAPATTVRINDCGFMPVQTPNQFGINAANYQVIRFNEQAPYFHPSIDIVLTPDKSKWTRCPVIELNNDPALSLQDPSFGDTPLPGLLRQSKSTDKAGRQLGDAGYNAQEANPNGDQPVGMGWFPGYAIDVESGRRLNMAFGENSLLINQNGGDMQWNPTSNMYNSVGAPLFGGQHAIYVFGGEFDGMPNYDQGNFLYEKLSNKTADDFRAAYRNLSWVMQPMLAENYELLATEVKIRVRWGKTFRNRSLTHWNHGQPLFEWNAVPYSSLFPKPDNSFLLVYPNPSIDNIHVQWENPEIDAIHIFNASGALVKKVILEPEQLEVTINIQNFAAGVYFLRAHDLTKKIVVTK
jgi:hypothetical protein